MPTQAYLPQQHLPKDWAKIEWRFRRLLTTASKDWAKRWSDAFDMGFDLDHIYSREDFTHEVSAAYGMTRPVWNGKSLNLDNACIIDNLSVSEKWNPSPHQKMQFIFGEDYDDDKLEKWIKITTFHGENDDVSDSDV